jgi:hypothetical protein
MRDEREKERNGSDINHVPAICRERRGSNGWKKVMRTGIRTRSAHDGYARSDELVLQTLVDVVQESSDVPWAQISTERSRKKRMSSLDRVFAFKHVVQSTISFPVSGASTNIRVYNGAAKLIQ